MENKGQKKTFKLVRRNPQHLSKDVIQKNLQPLYQNIEKKKFAQDMYYQSHRTHESPMIKHEKQPVHLRLGETARPQRLYRLPYGTNTANIGPKQRRMLKRPGTFMNDRRTRHFSAQTRLNNIRQNQILPNNAKKVDKMRKNIRNKSVPSSVVGAKPQNLRVQVSNPHYNQTRLFNKKFKLLLNPRLQAEIRTIQSHYNPSPLHLEGFRTQPVCTSLNLHDRFSEL